MANLKSILTFTLFLFGAALAQNDPWFPYPRYEAGWLSTHERFNNNSRDQGENVKIVFLGDSITQGWSSSPLWNSYYAPLGAANYGIGGDRVQHVLWRILKGNIDNINPDLAILKIGTNNLGANPNNDDIVRGIASNVETLRERLPNTKVLLLGVLPRTGEGNFQRIFDINLKAKRLENGDDIVFLDMWHDFALSWGVVDPALFSDGLHLTPAGYQQWKDSMDKTMLEMLG